MEAALRIKAGDFRSDHPEEEDQEIPNSYAEGLGGFQWVAISTRVSIVNPFFFTYFQQLVPPFFLSQSFLQERLRQSQIPSVDSK